MSIRTLTTLAIARDKAAPGQPASGGGGQAAVANATTGPAIPQQFVDVLTSAIPTEPLAAYTALIGIAAGTVDLMRPRAYLGFRWGAFAAFALLTVLAVAVSNIRKLTGPGGVVNPANRRAFPWAEGGAALIAAVAWGLAMPGSALNTQLTGTVRTITAASIAIGGAAILSLVFAPQLKTGTKSPGE